MNEITKRGRGRPKNSKSFETITLAELNARFNPDQKIPVGRIFLSGKQVVKNAETIQLETGGVSFTSPQQPTIEMKLTQ